VAHGQIQMRMVHIVGNVVDGGDAWQQTVVPGAEHGGELIAAGGRHGVAHVGLDRCNGQRFDAVGQLQRRYGGSVVLKGAGSLVHSGGSTPPALCTDGNPGMATGGMGDTLTGIIAGLLAQGLEPRDASECGVCLHATAADRVAADGGERGLLPSDLVGQLRSLVNTR